MAAGRDGESTTRPTAIERVSERELVVTRVVAGPVRPVFQAWTDPELFRRWWAPRSLDVTMVACELDVRTGGSYKLMMGHPSSQQPMVFFGRYLEVRPSERIVWTNEEDGGGGAVTTVTFEAHDGATRIVVHELYASKAALDEALASGSTGGWGEQFDQLDGLVREQGTA